MHDGDILILSAREVGSLLAGREQEIIETVRKAYIAHANGDSSLPHSTFLRFPDDPINRIIALPAYLGDGFGVAGIKWVASFPGNIASGSNRASAVVILNSPNTGRPEAILEGSLISAKRTAASAALAARCLHAPGPLSSAGLVGCGLINSEIAAFLMTVFPELRMFVLFDLDGSRIDRFETGLKSRFPEARVERASSAEEVLGSAPVISIATTAIQPHIFDLSACEAGSTILHVSLRDLSPEVLLSCDNIVDDIDHVSRAQTSVHLTEQLVGHRGFIRCTLADILKGAVPPRKETEGPAVFSPFGLGILDIAVGEFVRNLGLASNTGVTIESFLPTQ